MPPAEVPHRQSSHSTQAFVEEDISSGWTLASPISHRRDESPEVTWQLQAPPEMGGGPSPRTGRGLSAARAVASTVDPFGTPEAPPEAGGGPSPRTGRALSAARAVASTADPFGTPKAGYRG